MKQPKRLDHTKAYNAWRLEKEFGGVWSKNAVLPDPRGSGLMFQDHYMTMPDGSIWRPRVIHHYYSTACCKLMMIHSGNPSTDEACY